MVTSKQCLDKYGEPVGDNPWLAMYDIPMDLEIGVIPKKIWCNKDLVYPLSQALINLVSQGYAESELKTWDGCFNIRRMKGSQNMSLHSWGIAIDVNAFNNQFGKVPALSAGFVECFTSVGFDWGGNWRYQDGMHFQLSNI
jgi:hypothetical protein